MAEAKIGVFGGSGLYNLLEDVEEHIIDTPYGPPSSPIAIGLLGGQSVAFLARHGKHHQHPAHFVNYRANIYAMKSIGVERIIAPCSCGSLQKKIQPGDFVLLDQFIDRTSGRRDTYYNGHGTTEEVSLAPETGSFKIIDDTFNLTTHISVADPYCRDMRSIALDVLEESGLNYHSSGTMVVIQGPRFSTRAESKWFSANGWDVVGMTQYPECVLARELEMCYTGIALATDYDVGLSEDPSIEPVTADEVLKVFKNNIDNVRKLIFGLVPKLADERACDCGSALERARFV